MKNFIIQLKTQYLENLHSKSRRKRYYKGRNLKIALTGIAGAGKDYLGNSLKNYNRLSFSDQLKRIGKDIFEWIDMIIFQKKKKNL